MKQFTLRFLVRKWANFFFLIDNLAFPIDSMHEDYNQGWIKNFGQLSDKEKDALDRYRVLKRSIWDKGDRESLDRFEASFYQSSESDPREGEILQKILAKDQLQELNMVFGAFEDRFQSMWGDYQPVLSRALYLLEGAFSSVQQDFNQSLSAIGKLYGVDDFSKQVEVYLMMRPYPGFMGGRMLSRKPVPKILVGGGVPDPKNREQRNSPWLLLLHELTHACFENDKFFEFLYTYLGGKPPLSQFLEMYPATKTPTLTTRRAMREVVINSIEYNSYMRGRFEHSYTGSPKDGEVILRGFRDYFENKSVEDIKEKRSILLTGRNTTYQYIAWKLEAVVRPYLENGQKMDENFLDGVYKVLEDFPDNLLKDLQTEK